MRAVLALAACVAATVAAAAETVEQSLASLPADRWVQLPGGAVNAYARPAYDPASGRMIALLAGGNGTAHLDAATGRWVRDLAPGQAAVGGDCPLMKNYGLRDGRPNYGNMLLYNMVALDSRRGRILAGATSFFAAYDAAAKQWTDLKARVPLYGKDFWGAPPVAWGSMCYDPVNDQLVQAVGGAVFNFDRWQDDREVTGSFGTFIYDCEQGTWQRPKLGPECIHRARDLLRRARLELQQVMSRSGEAIVLDRQGKPQDASKGVEPVLAAQADVAAMLKRTAGQIAALADEPRLAAAAGRIEQAAAKLVPAGTADAVYLGQFAALQALLSARDEDLYTDPHPRCNAPMVYLPRQKSILLFGGTDGRQHLNDTWLYDCTKRRWRRVETRSRPRPREMHVLVYDTRLERAVMAGGYTSCWAEPRDELREAWTFDADAEDWRLVAKDFPFRRGESSYFAEYDAADDAIVLLRGGETFALRLTAEAALEAPPCGAYPTADRDAPFLPPAEDAAVLARWKALPANTWVPADPPGAEPGERGWGMLGFNSRLQAAILWGGGHSSYQANDIQLYFPGANRWVTAWPPHRINLAPWNKACGNPGGVDFDGGVFNLHARRGVGGNGGRCLITIQVFSSCWYGPDAFGKLPVSWGKVCTFEYDLFSRRWRMPCPPWIAGGMCGPDDASGSVVSVGTNGAAAYDWAASAWKPLSKAECPEPVSMGEGAGGVYVEKRRLAVVVGPVKAGEPIATWALELKSGTWRKLGGGTAPPGRPTALAYCDADDCLYAGCFTGYDRKTMDGQEAVYSFARDAWTVLPTRVQERVIKPGQPWKPTGLGAYHSAWSKVVYSPRYGLLLRHGEDGGMWVMRPDFDKLKF